MSLAFALALAAASARVESVGLTTDRSQLAVRVVVSGVPGTVAVHRDGDSARISIADTVLGGRFAGGSRFSWTPPDLEGGARARTPARLDRLELAASTSEVSLLVQVPPDASVDVQREPGGVLVRFQRPPGDTEPAARDTSAGDDPARGASSGGDAGTPVQPPSEPSDDAAASPHAPGGAPPEAAPSPPPPPPPPPAPPPPVTPDLARTLFPGGQSEPATGSGEPPSVSDLYGQLFPSGAPETSPEPASAAEAPAGEYEGIALGPFRVRAGVAARYVDADTFVDADADTTRDRYLEVGPRVQAEAPLGAGSFLAEYDPWLRAFATYDQINSSTHVARVALDLPVSGTVTLHAADRFVAGTLETRYADPGGEYFYDLGRFHRNDVDAGASVAVTPRTSLELSGTLGSVRFTEESSFFDYDDRRAAVGIGYELTPNLRAVGEYVYDAVPRPDERPEAELRAHEGRLTLRGDILPLLTGELAVGYRNQTTPNAGPGGTRYSGLTWQGALQRQLSPDAALGLVLTRTTPVSAYEQNGFYVSTGLRGTLLAPLPFAFLLDGGLAYQWNDYRTVASDIGVPREDRLFGWNLGLRRPIHRRLYLSGMYRAEYRRSNVDRFDVDTSGFYVQLEWNPLGASLR